MPTTLDRSWRALTHRFAQPTLIVLCFVLLPAAALVNQAGAPAKRTGAPGDGTGAPGNNGSCADVGCHDSFPVNSGVGNVAISAPDTFTDGEALDFVVAVHDTTRFRFGFQVTIKDAANANVGTFELIDANTRYATGNEDYVSHTLADANAEWTIRWNPPAGISEDVTIYAAGNAADNRFNAANDYVYETSKPIEYVETTGVDNPELPHEIIDVAIYPNPTRDNLTINVVTGLPAGTTVALYDATGRFLRRTDAGTLSAGDHRIVLRTNGLGAGVYFVRVETRNGYVARPIAIIR